MGMQISLKRTIAIKNDKNNNFVAVKCLDTQCQ